MGILSGLLGNANEADIAAVQQLLQTQFVHDEQIEKSYQIVRDLVTLTNKRIVLIDKQGVTGKKKEFVSIPYASIVKYAIRTSGHFDIDAELRIWLKGIEEPVSLEFSKDKQVSEIVQIITHYTCG